VKTLTIPYFNAGFQYFNVTDYIGLKQMKCQSTVQISTEKTRHGCSTKLECASEVFTFTRWAFFVYCITISSQHVLVL